MMDFEETTNRFLQARVPLDRLMAGEIEPPEEFESGILLKGAVHHLFSGPGMGKSFVALWLVKEALGRGQKVAYVDMENGPYIIAERLQALGVSPEQVGEGLAYLSSPGMSIQADDLTDWEELLLGFRPDLLVFDSWMGCLASAGMEENSNDDVTAWSYAYAKPARNLGITVLIIDHVPHEAKRSRGASRKKDEVDVQWQMLNPQPFDRDTVGEVVLVREKERQGWLPPSVTLSIGGKDGGFICRRSRGTVEAENDDGLTDSARKAFNMLLSGFDSAGATFTEWLKASSPMPRSTFGLAKQSLVGKGLVVQDDNKRYHANPKPPIKSNGPSGPPVQEEAEEQSNRESNAENGGDDIPLTYQRNEESNGQLDYQLDYLDSAREKESSPVHPPYRGGLDGLPGRTMLTPDEVELFKRLRSEGVGVESAREEVLSKRRNGGS